MKRHLIFICISLIIIAVSFLFTPSETNAINIGVLDFTTAIYISLINFSLVFIFTILSFTGLSFLFILAAMIGMGMAGSQSGIDPIVYYTSSFVHGIGEIIVLSIVFWFSVDHIKVLYKSVRYETKMTKLKNFYLNRGSRIVVLLFILSFINGFTEVYISNTLINLLF